MTSRSLRCTSARVARCLPGLLLAASAAAYAQSDASAPPVSPPPGFSAAASGPIDSIRKWLNVPSSEPELLPPEQAFQIAVRASDANRLVAELTPAPNYYLYRDRISFSVVQPPTVAIAKVTLPKGEPKTDPTFGTVEVFRRPVEAIIDLKRPDGQESPIQLRTTYQGCNEPLGVCYPPIEKTFTVALLGIASPAEPSPVPVADASGLPTGGPSDDGHIRQLFMRGSVWALVAAFFGFGLLLAFTPCMLPMIPILSGIIAGQEPHMTRRHALGLSLVYVLGMAITYALAGVAAGLAGTLLSAYLQNPWVLGGFAAIFVLLALSMFGLFELQLPASLQSRLARAGSRLKGGRVAGVFLMGVLSAVIVGPCVAAPLAGALLYIGQTRDIALGGVALFSLAIGMGAPLLVVGATAGTLLLKAGAWMESVKRLFGVVMLAVAIYLVSPVIPVVVQQLLWAALLVVSAIYLHALDPLPTDAPGYRRLFKGVGVLALLTGAALMVGVLSGHREILRPLAGIRGTANIERRELTFQPVNSVSELESRLGAARGQVVMLDFWAEWCVSCKEMDRFTFSDPRVQTRLKDAVLLRADVTANTPDHHALLQRFSLFGPPGIVFFDKQGREVAFRVIGYQAPEQFMASLDRALAP
ncbi:protein-disulfide reductase DsbD [Polaromonas sp. JS666]|uniref:protein-disulfide reductase DsbD n=1 Tax=Polaromonas sp. (strain JS666 / ATCC BAA-500) TaxID=296591 RepID=UPI0000D5B41C|nr:protein-disulfide reductase DsbD [Polaromonas sp. JS666]ABE45414.1 Protein-disulfide reductase [Polaromonas sp. JS666]